MDFTKLTKGKLIDAQPGFVDSWNRMVDCWNNLVGSGRATVKWPIDTVPTIDVPKKDDEDSGEDDDGEDDDLEDIPELVLPPFDPVRPSSSSLPGFFEIKDGNYDMAFYRVGTRIYPLANIFSVDSRKGFEALVILLDGPEPDASVRHFGTMGDVVSASSSPGVSVIPLYEFGEDGNVVRDLRFIPTAPVQEF